MITATRKVGLVAAVILASALVLTGCASESFFETGAPIPGSTAPGDEASTSPDAAANAKPEAKPVTQEETCDWDSSRK
ncbi:MAG: hypothetical protein ABIW32_04435, partial [Terrimesophilobacter sp.]